MRCFCLAGVAVVVFLRAYLRLQLPIDVGVYRLRGRVHRRPSARGPPLDALLPAKHQLRRRRKHELSGEMNARAQKYRFSF